MSNGANPPSLSRTPEGSERPVLHIVLGPTASGKERTALECARLLNGEIISVDSMKIYRTLDIGTAKATAAMREAVRHHLLDVAEPTESFSVADFVRLADAAIADIHARGKTVVLSGGTALYYKGLLEGLFDSPPSDQELRQRLQREAEESGTQTLHDRLRQADSKAAGRIHPNDLRRLVRALEIITLTGKPLSAQQQEWAGFQDGNGDNRMRPTRYACRIVALDWPRETLYARIAERVRRMMAQGLLEEARRVHEHRDTYNRTPLQAVGYKEFFPYFDGCSSESDAVELLTKNTRHLAKSQLTWFRKFPCAWLPMGEGETAESTARRVVAAWNELAFPG